MLFTHLFYIIHHAYIATCSKEILRYKHITKSVRSRTYTVSGVSEYSFSKVSNVSSGIENIWEDMLQTGNFDPEQRPQIITFNSGFIYSDDKLLHESQGFPSETGGKYNSSLGAIPPAWAVNKKYTTSKYGVTRMAPWVGISPEYCEPDGPLLYSSKVISVNSDFPSLIHVRDTIYIDTYVSRGIVDDINRWLLYSFRTPTSPNVVHWHKSFTQFATKGLHHTWNDVDLNTIQHSVFSGHHECEWGSTCSYGQSLVEGTHAMFLTTPHGYNSLDQEDKDSFKSKISKALKLELLSTILPDIQYRQSNQMSLRLFLFSAGAKTMTSFVNSSTSRFDIEYYRDRYDELPFTYQDILAHESIEKPRIGALYTRLPNRSLTFITDAETLASSIKYKTGKYMSPDAVFRDDSISPRGIFATLVRTYTLLFLVIDLKWVNAFVIARARSSVRGYLSLNALLALKRVVDFQFMKRRFDDARLEAFSTELSHYWTEEWRELYGGLDHHSAGLFLKGIKSQFIPAWKKTIQEGSKLNATIHHKSEIKNDSMKDLGNIYTLWPKSFRDILVTEILYIFALRCVYNLSFEDVNKLYDHRIKLKKDGPRRESVTDKYTRRIYNYGTRIVLMYLRYVVIPRIDAFSDSLSNDICKHEKLHVLKQLYRKHLDSFGLAFLESPLPQVFIDAYDHILTQFQKAHFLLINLSERHWTYLGFTQEYDTLQTEYNNFSLRFHEEEKSEKTGFSLNPLAVHFGILELYQTVSKEYDFVKQEAKPDFLISDLLKHLFYDSTLMSSSQSKSIFTTLLTVGLIRNVFYPFDEDRLILNPMLNSIGDDETVLTRLVHGGTVLIHPYVDVLFALVLPKPVVASLFLYIDFVLMNAGQMESRGVLIDGSAIKLVDKNLGKKFSPPKSPHLRKPVSHLENAIILNKLKTLRFLKFLAEHEGNLSVGTNPEFLSTILWRCKWAKDLINRGVDTDKHRRKPHYLNIADFIKKIRENQIGRIRYASQMLEIDEQKERFRRLIYKKNNHIFKREEDFEKNQNNQIFSDPNILDYMIYNSHNPKNLFNMDKEDLFLEDTDENYSHFFYVGQNDFGSDVYLRIIITDVTIILNTPLSQHGTEVFSNFNEEFIRKIYGLKTRKNKNLKPDFARPHSHPIDPIVDKILGKKDDGFSFKKFFGIEKLNHSLDYSDISDDEVIKNLKFPKGGDLDKIKYNDKTEQSWLSVYKYIRAQLLGSSSREYNYSIYPISEIIKKFDSESNVQILKNLYLPTIIPDEYSGPKKELKMYILYLNRIFQGRMPESFKTEKFIDFEFKSPGPVQDKSDVKLPLVLHSYLTDEVLPSSMSSEYELFVSLSEEDENFKYWLPFRRIWTMILLQKMSISKRDLFRRDITSLLKKSFRGLSRDPINFWDNHICQTNWELSHLGGLTVDLLLLNNHIHVSGASVFLNSVEEEEIIQSPSNKSFDSSLKIIGSFSKLIGEIFNRLTVYLSPVKSIRKKDIRFMSTEICLSLHERFSQLKPPIEPGSISSSDTSTIIVSPQYSDKKIKWDNEFHDYFRDYGVPVANTIDIYVWKSMEDRSDLYIVDEEDTLSFETGSFNEPIREEE